jgi:hypothetical protein
MDGRVYPVEQFTGDGRVLDGLPEVLAAFRGITLATRWRVLRAHSTRMDATVFELLRRGDVEAARFISFRYGEMGA